MTKLPDFGRLTSPPAGRGVRAPAPSLKRADADLLPPDAAGEFEGYASVFGVMDLGRDVVLPGAFRATLERRGARGVKLLWQHDPAQPIGEWREIREDRHGLYVRGALDLGHARGREALRLMRRGAVDGLSIGYRSEAERRDPATGLRRLERVDLWEISLVTFPLLPQARVRSVKAAWAALMPRRGGAATSAGWPAFQQRT
ncbi:HK97 family phage prohead protease [Rhabdaerophilum calidifontis]|uniref:HK97 family phage prohead protease n=1 Tax=Rhabdaerophilum calidifontis TaxID=2604328 RepID=UPI00123AD322|nr:HK97 family phage prohead protease [Rhabdaerophilum calidifontis]